MLFLRDVYFMSYLTTLKEWYKVDTYIFRFSVYDSIHIVNHWKMFNLMTIFLSKNIRFSSLLMPKTRRKNFFLLFEKFSFHFRIYCVSRESIKKYILKKRRSLCQLWLARVVIVLKLHENIAEQTKFDGKYGAYRQFIIKMTLKNCTVTSFN